MLIKQIELVPSINLAQILQQILREFELSVHPQHLMVLGIASIVIDYYRAITIKLKGQAATAFMRDQTGRFVSSFSNPVPRLPSVFAKEWQGPRIARALPAKKRFRFQKTIRSMGTLNLYQR